ncbi:unnamed protein product [Adineta steineri]|uniref:EGF-like domain-containing protein n=1 Tax=Adineta steineri TaxID=433720 RepID=A0A815CY20_9BILA|nr:unnamed protein product [Adineta steineri]CAF1290198.1 unnamed protein product [Adineta steineri]CAF1342674.1 unnamed protein product [Adineta steineri]CAF1568570.1 unnamed protein product [Adineta steineri]
MQHLSRVGIIAAMRMLLACQFSIETILTIVRAKVDIMGKIVACRFGPHCNLQYDECNSNPCLSDGTCAPNYDMSGEASYICICSQRFYGNQCQNTKASVHINLNIANISSVRATVVQLYNIGKPSFLLIMQHGKVYHGVPSVVQYNHADFYAPYVGVLKIYEDFAHPKYFIMYALLQMMINITSSPEHCPHVSSLLSEFTNSSVPIVFRYHHICQNDNQSFCFHDENYLCICDSDNYRAECFIHNPQIDHCGCECRCAKQNMTRFDLA